MGSLTYAQEIIKKKRELESVEQEDYYHPENNIEKGYIIIKYEKLILEEKELLDGRIQMCMPREYDLMKEETIAIKYPDQNRPQWIYTNKDCTVDFTFHLEEGEVKNEEVNEIRNLLLEQMKRIYPCSAMEEVECLMVEERNISYFSFPVILLDGVLYHFMFFTAIKGGLLVGGFHCSEYEKKQWKPILKQFLGTLKEKV